MSSIEGRRERRSSSLSVWLGLKVVYITKNICENYGQTKPFIKNPVLEKDTYVHYLSHATLVSWGLCYFNYCGGTFSVCLEDKQKQFRFSPTRPHWAELVIESPCPSVGVCVCLRHRVQFFSRPLAPLFRQPLTKGS